jgi:hypothetical protein
MRWNGWVDEELRRELLARAEEDQRVRRLASPPKGQYEIRLSDAAAEEWRRVDTGNTQWLADVLATRGWPGRTLAGTDGEFGPCPIEDPARLEERRAEAGMEPFTHYQARIRGRTGRGGLT